MELQLIDYKPEYQPWFEKLNKAWLEEYFVVEPFDKWVLENPEEALLKDGGQIYFAASNGAIIGTVALRFLEGGVYELTKMAVDKSYHAGGAGQFLCSAAIAKAGELGAHKLVLWSSRILANAIHIYRKLGFTEIPVEPGTYGRADIMMEINLDAGSAMSEDEVKELRADTRGTANVIHFNNAGASLPPDVVVNAIYNYLDEEATNGGYETESKNMNAIDEVYRSIARLINAETTEIAVVENASTAWSTAFNGIAFEEGDEVITSEMEYVTNLMGFLNLQKTKGVQFKVIPNDASGNFPVKALETAITARTKLIAITHVPSGSGAVIPVTAIGAIARKHNILYLVDACQSAGQMPLDVKSIGCDMLSVTGRKYLRGPRGTGFLFVRKEVQDRIQPTFFDGFNADWVSETDFKLKDNARRYELFEKSRALTLGLGKAVEYALSVKIERIWERVQLLAASLRQTLASVSGITVHDKGTVLCGIVTFSAQGIAAAEVKSLLAKRRINVSVSNAVSTLIYMNNQQLTAVVRASVHYYNTMEEIEQLCRALREIAEGIAPMVDHHNEG